MQLPAGGEEVESWYLGNKRLNQSNSNGIRNELSLKNVRASDGGVYICQGKKNTIRMFRVYVFCKYFLSAYSYMASALRDSEKLPVRK